VQVHKKGTKVQSVCANPVDNNIVLTAGNDREARVLDVRYLGQSDAHVASTPGSRDVPSVPNVCEVFSFSHPRVINAAYFSPISGRKILTTAQDNRLRVWDNFTVGGASPDREIVHSQ
jgi:DNA damage-binding protein 2